jgi:tetratricopeptide (TPR) repeat protein
MAAFVGEPQAAKDAVRHSLELDRNAGRLVKAAFALAATGDTAAARRLVDEARRMPDADTTDGKSVLAVLTAVIRDIEDKRGPIGEWPPLDHQDDGVVFAHALLELQHGQASDAASELKQLLDRQTKTGVSLVGPLSNLYYGRALAKLGRRDESRAAYDRFLDLWKSADPDLPIMVAAKQERLALQ